MNSIAARIDMKSLSPFARLPILFFGMLALVIGVLSGLARLALDVPLIAAAHAGTHGPLMIAAFLGTVISMERAVAIARRWPYLAPLCAGLGGLALLLGFPMITAHALFIAAATILFCGSGLILRQQPAPHTATLALGALSWLIGNLLWYTSGAVALAVPWWIAFLVLTIAGERLELTRFLPTPPSARRVFAALVALMLTGLASSYWDMEFGLRLFAATLLALALWLLRHDIARRTVRQSGLTRYIAICLLSGYVWLALSGLLGMAGGFSPGSPLRDATLHAVFLGFVVSMIFGHAPIIFPAVAKIRMPYHSAFYLPLAVLHASLLARAVGDLTGIILLTRAAGIANATALLIFFLTVLVSVGRGKSRPDIKENR
ncbi:MAG: hypothetical protein WC073_07270 [Sterolibacterium sp.]